MGWTRQIDRCDFMLDYVSITILLKKPDDLVPQLSRYAQQKGKPVLEKYAKPRRKDKIFQWRSYFGFGKIVKMYLIHGKKVYRKNIDAQLVLHDVPILELVQIEYILDAMPCVTGFFLSRIEFKWDLYPKKSLSAADLQKHIVRHLHLKSAQGAFTKGKEPRITYYIGQQPCDLQIKVYVRPKVPSPGLQEFVRLELDGRRRWLKECGLIRPYDFEKVKLKEIVRQVKWLDMKPTKLRRIQPSLLSGGEYKTRILEKLEKKGIAKAIIDHRKNKVCLPGCAMRGHPHRCKLNRAFGQNIGGPRLLIAIRSCEFSKPNDRFEAHTCEPSKYSRAIKTIMRRAYREWFTKLPKFPVSVPMAPIKGTKKSSVAAKNNLKFHILFP